MDLLGLYRSHILGIAAIFFGFGPGEVKGPKKVNFPTKSVFGNLKVDGP